jgi:hypothetical protein
MRSLVHAVCYVMLTFVMVVNCTVLYFAIFVDGIK